jgi:tRNA pseudouridine55 synthase
VRRILGERRVGHTGTLDPLASGVLPLVIGRATRLARFLSVSDKTYEAEVTLGVATDSGDREGRPLGDPHAGPWPDQASVERALAAFRGTYLQRPPALSAKKIGGVRSYTLARQSRARIDGAAGGATATLDGEASPEPVTVTVSALDVLSCGEGTVVLRLTCSAGFYVRSLARDLGDALGTGAHLSALRRTATGPLRLDQAVPLAQLDDRRAGRQRAVAALLPLDRMLTDLPAVSLTPDGVRIAGHGRDLGPSMWVAGTRPPAAAGCVRLLDEHGHLVGIAEPSSAPGLLHPAVILM